MIVGKVFEFPSKPEQPGLSSSIRLEIMMERTGYMQIDQFNWRSHTPAYLLNFYSSLPRRMVAVIAAEGGAMKY